MNDEGCLGPRGSTEGVRWLLKIEFTEHAGHNVGWERTENQDSKIYELPSIYGMLIWETLYYKIKIDIVYKI